jgi:hypothetical protein
MKEIEAISGIFLKRDTVLLLRRTLKRNTSIIIIIKRTLRKRKVRDGKETIFIKINRIGRNE